MKYHAGRHFLQIPGPTNVPDRVLRAIDFPTMDHRGPDFAALGKACIAGLKKVFKTEAHVVIYPASGTGRLGGGAREYAFTGRSRPDERDRPVRRALAETRDPPGAGH